MKGWTRAGAFAAAALFCGGQANAQSVAEFYAGKTVTINVGQQAGTGFDVYARVLIRHFGRFIPGNPKLVVQNMPGASGINSVNWLYNIAPKDGTVIGTTSQNVPLEPLFGNAKAKFDPTKLIWIGNMESGIAVCGISTKAGVKTFAELQKADPPVIFGATGATGPLKKTANAVKELLGAKIKVVAGYRGSASVKQAMEKGEVFGICGLPWSTIKSFWRSDLETGAFKPIIQLSGPDNPELGKIPKAQDFIKTEEQKQLFGLIFGSQVLGRSYMLPPRVPKDRVDALRKAFMDTMKDKQFLADAAKAGIDIVPSDGEEVTKLWAEFLATPKTVADKVKQITLPDVK
ncbi:MAG: Bug family tripartite tricarboxylate transporter substrate binding protein [Beijerinckiaceae bacterium]